MKSKFTISPCAPFTTASGVKRQWIVRKDGIPIQAFDNPKDAETWVAEQQVMEEGE